MPEISHHVDPDDAPVSSPTISARTFIIAFVAILVATGVFSLTIALKVRRDAIVMTDQVRLVGEAMLAYSTAHEAFPPDRATLEAFPAGGNADVAMKLSAALDRVSVTWPELPGAAPQLSAGGRPVRHGVTADVQELLDAEAARLGGAPEPAIR